MVKNILVSRFIRIVTLLAISIGLLILLMAWAAPKPPTAEFKTYNVLVANSYSFCIYNKELFDNADFFRQQAYNAWQEQNKKFFLNRDFSEAKRMILMSISIIEEANTNIKNIMETTVLDTNSFIEDTNFEHRAVLNQQKWEAWVLDAIEHSKNGNTTVLIIDKKKHSCFVIENGTLVQDYIIEIGVNYLNDKNSAKDNATPEGYYYTASKKESAEKNHHKTILLNFPNKEDKLRFEKAFQNKEISDLDILNYKLSIHGNGGKGYDWTDGSIALSKTDIEILYSQIKIGTRVVIVGTTEGILNITGISIQN